MTHFRKCDDVMETSLITKIPPPSLLRTMYNSHLNAVLPRVQWLLLVEGNEGLAGFARNIDSFWCPRKVLTTSSSLVNSTIVSSEFSSSTKEDAEPVVNLLNLIKIEQKSAIPARPLRIPVRSLISMSRDRPAPFPLIYNPPLKIMTKLFRVSISSVLRPKQLPSCRLILDNASIMKWDILIVLNLWSHVRVTLVWRTSH